MAAQKNASIGIANVSPSWARAQASAHSGRSVELAVADVDLRFVRDGVGHRADEAELRVRASRWREKRGRPAAA